MQAHFKMLNWQSIEPSGSVDVTLTAWTDNQLFQGVLLPGYSSKPMELQAVIKQMQQYLFHGRTDRWRSEWINEHALNFLQNVRVIAVSLRRRWLLLLCKRSCFSNLKLRVTAFMECARLTRETYFK